MSEMCISSSGDALLPVWGELLHLSVKGSMNSHYDTTKKPKTGIREPSFHSGSKAEATLLRKCPPCIQAMSPSVLFCTFCAADSDLVFFDRENLLFALFVLLKFLLSEQTGSGGRLNAKRGRQKPDMGFVTDSEKSPHQIPQRLATEWSRFMTQSPVWLIWWLIRFVVSTLSIPRFLGDLNCVNRWGNVLILVNTLLSAVHL